MDYVLTLSDNVKVGTAKVSIAGKGNFSGTQDKTFAIEKNPAKWMSDSRGWWYSNGDDTYPSSCWKEIDGSIYYFDASGYMKTGWVSDDREKVVLLQRLWRHANRLASYRRHMVLVRR